MILHRVLQWRMINQRSAYTKIERKLIEDDDVERVQWCGDGALRGHIREELEVTVGIA